LAGLLDILLKPVSRLRLGGGDAILGFLGSLR
jgi:hypothetical protein